MAKAALSRTDLSFGFSAVSAERGLAVQGGDTELEFGDLTVEVPWRSALVASAPGSVDTPMTQSPGNNADRAKHQAAIVRPVLHLWGVSRARMTSPQW